MNGVFVVKKASSVEQRRLCKGNATDREEYCEFGARFTRAAKEVIFKARVNPYLYEYVVSGGGSFFLIEIPDGT